MILLKSQPCCMLSLEKMVECTRYEFRTRNEVHHFAQEVIDFSSQYGSDTSISYTISNLAGQCNIYPSYGDYTQAAVFRTYGHWWNICPSAPRPFRQTLRSFVSKDFIELSFKEKVFPIKIEIYETYNPGALVRVLACDTSCRFGKSKGYHTGVRWFVLWSGQPQYDVSSKANVFIPGPFSSCPFPTDLIRLEFNSCLLEYYTELDAVCLVGCKTTEPCLISDINLGDDVIYTNGNFESLDIESKDLDNIACPRKLPSSELFTRGLVQLHLQDGLSAALDTFDNGYFDVLPQEVIQLIISYLELPSICCLAMTCQLFYKHCYDPMQYIELDLQPFWPKMSDLSLSDLCSRCTKLQRLNLSWCGNRGMISLYGFKKFLSVCSVEDLVCLRLACCSFVDGAVLQCIASECVNLQELDLHCCRRIVSNAFAHVSKLKKLQRFVAYRTSIDSSSIIAIIRSCPEMEHLNLGSCTTIQNYDDVAINLGNYCRVLKSLDVWRAKTLTDIGLKALGTGCQQLEELDAGWCTDLHSGTGCFVEFTQNCSHLKKLFLTANRTVCDRDLEAVAKYSRHLQQLDILGTREVSIQSILRVLNECKELQFLDLSFCSGIEPSLINIWKQKFPHVSIKRSYQDVS